MKICINKFDCIIIFKSVTINKDKKIVRRMILAFSYLYFDYVSYSEPSDRGRLFFEPPGKLVFDDGNFTVGV